MSVESKAEILDRAIARATQNGWQGHTKKWPIEALIYDNDFAKALWGETPRNLWADTEDGGIKYKGKIPDWQYHLQQMVIADDVFEYFRECIGSDTERPREKRELR